jgi:hypothetical protein
MGGVKKGVPMRGTDKPNRISESYTKKVVLRTRIR